MKTHSALAHGKPSLIAKWRIYHAPRVQLRSQAEKLIETDGANEWIHKSLEIPGWLFPGEHEFLWELASRPCEGQILEIGTWMGKSTCILAGACIDHAPSTKVLCIDPFDMQGVPRAWITKLLQRRSSTFDRFIEGARRLGFMHAVVPIATTSEQALPVLHCTLRMAFIDGWHDYAHAKADVELCLPKLVTGGVLALHDATGEFPGVAQYVDEALRTDPTLHYIDSKGTIVAFEKG